MRTLFPNLPVLYTSGYTSDILALKDMLNESIVLLKKPYSIKSLAGKIREILNRK